MSDWVMGRPWNQIFFQYIQKSQHLIKMCWQRSDSTVSDVESEIAWVRNMCFWVRKLYKLLRIFWLKLRLSRYIQYKLSICICAGEAGISSKSDVLKMSENWFMSKVYLRTTQIQKNRLSQHYQAEISLCASNFWAKNKFLAKKKVCKFK